MNIRSRWAGFALSLVFHGAAVGAIFWGDVLLDVESDPAPRYDVVMLPRSDPAQKKIIWYDYRQATPEIVPEKAFGSSEIPRGELPGQTIVAHSTEANASSKQFIWRPDRPEPLPADVPAPNLLALPDSPSPRPKTPVRPFAPPPAPTQAIADAGIEAPPVVQSEIETGAGVVDGLAKPRKGPVREFVAPARAATPGSTGALLDPGAVASSGMGGTSDQDLRAVIVGLEPKIGPLPEGSRPGQFSRAPSVGPASSGRPGNGAAKVPGLMAKGTPGSSPEPGGVPAPSIERRVLKETPYPTLNRTMSAPLRPSSRVIPSSVEAQFARRNVYTLLIPGPDLPGYVGDWVLWFSERQPAEGQSSRISAPVPARKYSWTGTSSGSDTPASGTAMLAALIDRGGRISAAKVIRGPANEAFRRRAVEELQAWEFRPALRNGEPIAVDVVVEIQFAFRPGMADAR